MTELLAIPEIIANRNAELKARYSRIDDPMAAINFACDAPLGWSRRIDFLETWRDGAWNEIEQAYPEFLEGVA